MGLIGIRRRRRASKKYHHVLAKERLTVAIAGSSYNYCRFELQLQVQVTFVGSSRLKLQL